MADKAIEFSEPMILALRASRKTQTRRLIKLRKGITIADLQERGEKRAMPGGGTMHHATRDMLDPPAYAVGDRIWVKEAWRTAESLDGLSPKAIGEKALDAGYPRPWAPLQYEADVARNAGWHDFGSRPGTAQPGRNRNARYMPRWASRLTLTVTDVRVQRVQEISDADAIAEGIEAYPDAESEWWSPGLDVHPTARGAYAALWNSLHGPDAWEQSPWVAAYTFTVEQRNIDRG